MYCSYALCIALHSLTTEVGSKGIKFDAKFDYEDITRHSPDGKYSRYVESKWQCMV